MSKRAGFGTLLAVIVEGPLFQYATDGCTFRRSLLDCEALDIVERTERTRLDYARPCDLVIFVPALLLPLLHALRKENRSC